MSRGYRGFFVALAGLVLAAAQQPNEYAQTGHGAQQEQGAPAPSAPPRPAAEAPYRPYPYYDPDPCYRAKDHDAADLCAQWRAAIAAEKAAHEARRATTWAVISALLSFVTVAGLIITILQTQGALKEAARGNRLNLLFEKRSRREGREAAADQKKALRIASRNAKAAAKNADATERAITETQRIGEAQTRAYLTIRNAVISPLVEEPGFLLSFDLVNTGNSPALKLLLEFQVRWMHGTNVAEGVLCTGKQLVNNVSASQTERVEDIVKNKNFSEFWPNQYANLDCSWVELKIVGEDVFGKEIDTVSHWVRFWKSGESRLFNIDLSPANTAIVLRAGEIERHP